MKSRLLILTPTLGTSSYLDETVRSVAQFSLPISHVLVCPASAVAALAERFPACRVVVDAGRDGGLYGALNAGLAAMGGTPWDWYTYINDDDRLSPGFGEMMARHDARGDLATVAYGNVETMDDDGHSLGCMTVESRAEYFPALLQGGISPVGQQGMVFGAPVVRALGGYDTRYRICADLDFWVRAHARGFAFRYYGLEVGRFRIRSGQISGDVSVLRQQVDEITRTHYPTPVSPAARRFARLRYRWRNLPRYLGRLGAVGLASSLDVLQTGGRRPAGKP